MKTFIGLLVILGIIATVIGFIGFMFSIHWSLGVISILLVLSGAI